MNYRFLCSRLIDIASNTYVEIAKLAMFDLSNPDFSEGLATVKFVMKLAKDKRICSKHINSPCKYTYSVPTAVSRKMWWNRFISEVV